MTKEEKIKKIEEIYQETITKVEALEKQQKQLVGDYIHKLEEEKIEKIRKSLLE